MNFNLIKFNWWVFAAGLLYILPLILSSVDYTDDIGRSVSGYGWGIDGRFMSTLIMQMLSFNQWIAPISPYTQILAAVITCLTGIISVKAIYKKEECVYFLSLILLTSPFYLENLSYKFDSLSMALSILLSVFPLLFIEKSYFIPISVASLTLSLAMYQTSAMVYFSIVLCYFIYREQELSFSEFVKVSSSAFVSFLLSFLIYSSILKCVAGDVARSEFLSLDGAFINTILFRTHAYYDFYSYLLNSGYSLAFLPFAIVVIYSYFSNLIFGNESIIRRILLYPLFTLMLLVLTMLPNIVLEEPWYTARTMIAFPFLIFGLSVICVKHAHKLVVFTSIFILYIYGYSISAVYSNVLKDNDKYDDFITTSITEAIISNSESGTNNVIIIGRSEYPQKTRNLYQVYPILYKLAPLYSTQDWSWGVRNLSRYTSLNYVYDARKRQEAYANLCKNEIIKTTSLYTLRKSNEYYLVDFNKTKC
ncbi:TPA: hypothetical protein IG090_003485 [Escherichia coli]|nr:hypothetical protein [Escherichia coli]